MWLAWNLQALLPGTGALLADGDLTLAKARAVDTALNLLSGEDAAKAEAMIVPELPGKTYGQAQKLAVQAALTVDPESATRRREDAERNKCRVQMFREETGAAGLSGRDLPTDQTLAAHASVCARAQEYKESGAFPDDTRMDQFRVAAYLDLLNGIPAATRIAAASSSPPPPEMTGAERRFADPDAADEPPATDAPLRQLRARSGRARHAQGPECGRPRARACPMRTRQTRASPMPEDATDAGRGDDDQDDGTMSGSGGSGPQAAQAGRWPSRRPSRRPRRPQRRPSAPGPGAPAGHAARPGRTPRRGPRARPARSGPVPRTGPSPHGSPWTQLCVTVTDADGIAIGHGCGRAERQHAPPSTRPSGIARPGPARPREPDRHRRRLAELAATGPPAGSGPPRLGSRPARQPPGSWSLSHRRSRARPAASAPGRSPCPTAGTSPCA